MPFLTIFSAPKAFSDPHIATIQKNAIRSWLHLGNEVQVVLIGDEPGLADVARELNVHLYSQVIRNSSGTPLVSSIFQLGRETSQGPFVLYTNADILMLPEIVEATHQVASSLGYFLMVGQRWDLDVREELDFSPGWDQRLKAEVHARGEMHTPSGSDFFIFPRSLFNQIPDFAIGRAGWDNWMIYHARQNKWPVIDVTPSAMVIHQAHDYRHLPGGRPHYELPESQLNQDLAGGSSNLYMVLDSDRQLVNGKIQRPPLTLVRALRRSEVWLTPPDGNRDGLRWSLARQARRLRRRLTGSLQD